MAEKYTESAGSLNVPISQSQAKCRATVYLESDLSDEALADVREGKDPVARTDKDREVLNEISGKLAECLDPD